MTSRTRALSRIALLGATALVIALASSMWRPSAQPGAVNQGTPVRVLGEKERLSTPPGEKGATYYWLEEQTSKATTRFRDGVAIAERGIAGDIHTRLLDAGGNEIATLHAKRVDAATTELVYRTHAGQTMRMAGEARLRPTLDWASRQVRALSSDQAAERGVALEWRDGFIRPIGAAHRDLDADVREIQIDWAKGVSAKVVRKAVSPGLGYKGREVEGEMLASQISVDGTQVGESAWYPRLQLLTWDLPGLSKSFLAPEHLREQYGGWPFTPDMAWLNLQTIAFHYFKTRIDAEGYVARLRQPRGNGLLQFFMPTLHADTEGCDGFHWLDGTVFRYCCDVHDACYSKFGCAMSTWWLWWSSWTCDLCNMNVIGCVGGGGTHGPFDRWY